MVVCFVCEDYILHCLAMNLESKKKRSTLEIQVSIFYIPKKEGRTIEYVTIKRARFNSFSGQVNIPYGTLLESRGVLLFLGKKPICYATSENAHQFFAVNDDGKGLERGKLTQAIQKHLNTKDDDYQTRWDKVWADPLCRKFKREEHEDYWIWNHEFYNAKISELLYIAALIKVKGVKLCTKS